MRTNLARQAWEYPWSSAAAHVGHEDASGVLDLALWRKYEGSARWRQELSVVEDREIQQRLRMRTQTGRPLTSDSFLSKLEAQFGKRLRPLPVGQTQEKAPKNT